MVIQFVVFGYDKHNMTIDVCERESDLMSVTVLDLRQKIAQRLPGNPDTAVAEMELIFGGERLDGNCKTLSSFGLIHRSVIQMVINLDGGLRCKQETPP